MGCVGSKREREQRGRAVGSNPAFTENGAPPERESRGGPPAAQDKERWGGDTPLSIPAAVGAQAEGTAERSDVDAAASATSDAANHLMPGGQMPECASLWVNNRKATPGTSKWAKQTREAAEWALKALCHAHDDPRLKKAVRRLLAVQHFTKNLDSGRDENDRIQKLFTNMLRPGLRARLVELGAPLKDAHKDADLARRLSDDAVAEAVGRPQDHPLAIERERSGVGGRPTQIDLMPSVDAFVDFGKPEEYPDAVYAHAVLMVSAARDASFQATVARVVREHNEAWERKTGEPGTTKHSAAPTKAYARVMTKGKSDYRYDAAPRAQHNVDVVRCLVTADTPEELLALSERLAKDTFGGVVRVKNLFVAPEAERAERFHLLPLMLTVAIGGGGETYGEFVRRLEVVEAFDAYVAVREITVPPTQWKEMTARARTMLESDELSGVPVRLLGELQMVLTGHAKVRHEMHEVYKAYRAESAVLLWEDYARTAKDDGEGGAVKDELAQEPWSLWSAAGMGNRPALESFLRRDGADVNEVGGTGTTAVFVATQRGYTDVVKVLVDSRADVSLKKSDHLGQVPLHAAAKDGHTDIVHILLSGGADVNAVRADDGSTPLYWAATKGHADVARVLLDSGADVNAARTDNGNTPLTISAEKAYTDVARVLIDGGADVNKARTTDGVTPLYWAANQDNTDMVRLLLGNGADVNLAKTDDGQTPLHAAALSGHANLIPVLVNAGADVHAVTTRGHTALRIAEKMGHAKAAAALRAAATTA